MPDERDPAWKVKLRYGKTSTPYQHYTVLADGVVEALRQGFECRPGRAWMGIKVWAASPDEAFGMTKAIAHDIGFVQDGKMELYSTDPSEPPGENPYGYDIRFTPYDEDA